MDTLEAVVCQFISCHNENEIPSLPKPFFCLLLMYYKKIFEKEIDYTRACIDTSERGDLENGIHLGEYRVTHQWASLTAADQYNISINVHNDGNILEIVGMCCKLTINISMFIFVFLVFSY